MPSSQDKRWQLLSDLFFGRIPDDRFLQEFGATRENIGSVIKDMLKEGLEKRLPDTLEEVVPLMYHFGISREYLDLLNALAIEPWHRKHEDIVFALGKIKDPSSIPVLAQTAVAAHPYLEVDESFALGTKSIHALRNIETPEAIREIGTLARNDNEVLKKTALGLLKDVVGSNSDAEAKAEAKRQLEQLK